MEPKVLCWIIGMVLMVVVTAVSFFIWGLAVASFVLLGFYLVLMTWILVDIARI